MTGRGTADGTEEALPLTDRLAAHRTRLANERTFLAYSRTALTLVAVGMTFIKFFEHAAVVVLGWLMLPAGVYAFIKGLESFRSTKQRIRDEEKI